MADEPKNNSSQGGDGRSARRGGRRYFRRKSTDESRRGPDESPKAPDENRKSSDESRKAPEARGRSERSRADGPPNKGRSSGAPARSNAGGQRGPGPQPQRSSGGNSRAAAEARAQEEKRARRRRRRLRQRGGPEESRKPETTVSVSDITDYVAPKSVFIYTAVVHAEVGERYESRVEHFSQVGRTLEDYEIDLRSLFAEDGTIKNTRIKFDHNVFNFSDDDAKPEEKPSLPTLPVAI